MAFDDGISGPILAPRWLLSDSIGASISPRREFSKHEKKQKRARTNIKVTDQNLAKAWPRGKGKKRKERRTEQTERKKVT